MVDPNRTPFGVLVCDPDELDRAGRVDCLRRLSGSLQAGRTRESAWLGRVLGAWLATDGADLEALLGVKPPRGSHATPQKIARRHRR